MTLERLNNNYRLVKKYSRDQINSFWYDKEICKNKDAVDTGRSKVLKELLDIDNSLRYTILDIEYIHIGGEKGIIITYLEWDGTNISKSIFLFKKEGDE